MFTKATIVFGLFFTVSLVFSTQLSKDLVAVGMPSTEFGPILMKKILNSSAIHFCSKMSFLLIAIWCGKVEGMSYFIICHVFGVTFKLQQFFSVIYVSKFYSYCFKKFPVILIDFTILNVAVFQKFFLQFFLAFRGLCNFFCNPCISLFVRFYYEFSF